MRLPPGTRLIGRGVGALLDLAVDATAVLLEPPVERAMQRRERTAGDGAGSPEASEAAVAKAEQLGVDLGRVEGSGRDGMVTARDVLARERSVP